MWDQGSSSFLALVGLRSNPGALALCPHCPLWGTWPAAWAVSCPGCCPIPAQPDPPCPAWVPSPSPVQACGNEKMSGLYFPLALCSYSAMLDHRASLPTSPKITPDSGFLCSIFAYPELKIVPNFVNTLCCCGCKFIIYVVSCMIFNLWQLGVFSSEVFITHYYVLFVLP